MTDAKLIIIGGDTAGMTAASKVMREQPGIRCKLPQENLFN